MKNTVFKGVATAIVTPFTKDGIDYEQFGKLIDWQISEGVNAIVAVGTTGEGSTLSDAEHKEAIKFCVDKVAGRVPVIAGTGSNDTAYAIELTKYSCEVGADAMLLVTPYYNKTTQRDLSLLSRQSQMPRQSPASFITFLREPAATSSHQLCLSLLTTRTS